MLEFAMAPSSDLNLPNWREAPKKVSREIPWIPIPSYKYGNEKWRASSPNLHLAAKIPPFRNRDYPSIINLHNDVCTVNRIRSMRNSHRRAIAEYLI